MKTLRGVMPPVVTLFDKDGKIDWEANFRHQDFLMEKGVDGGAYLGTTGEFPALTLDEKKEFLEKMCAHAAGKITFIAGASDTCLKNVLDLARHCEKIGADGLLIVPPYFSVYPGNMVAAFFEAVAESTALPIILYNFPALTGFEMTEEWVEKLALKCPNIVGIKETIPTVEHIRGMLRVKKARPDFRVYAAYDDQFLDARRLGVDGFIHAAGNFAPEAGVAMWKSADEPEMQASYRAVMGAMAVYGESQPLYLAVKEAVYQREGFRCGERLPALPLTEEKKAAVHRILLAEGLIAE